ncbi:MAG: DUF222 domain-containing protein [Lapillicoccus sp.]
MSVGVAAVEQALVEPWWRLGDSGVREVLVALGRLRTVLDRVEVAAVGEAIGRGLPKDVGLSSVDWVVAAEGADSPVPDPRRVSQVVAVATACRTLTTEATAMPGVGVFAQAFTAGVMAVDKAGMIARFAADVKAVGDPDAVGADVEVLVAAASDDATGRALTGRELRRAIALATRLLTPDRELERDEDRQRLARSLTKTSGPTALTGAAGLSTYRMVLDAEGAAIIDTAVAALSAPVPDTDGCGNRQLDPRPAATRRADALLLLVGRGVTTGPLSLTTPLSPPTPLSLTTDDPDTEDSKVLGGPAVGDRAQVVVTIPFDQLIGAVQGAGLTTSGELLSPAVVRRMACNARIIPMVLGGDGQLLDLGRGRRFFTPAQRLAVWRRDHHCTYPGCTIPSAWTDVHHVVRFSRGGPTAMDNAALLCQRHHTLVHSRELTASVDPTGVTWHL